MNEMSELIITGLIDMLPDYIRQYAIRERVRRAERKQMLLSDPGFFLEHPQKEFPVQQQHGLLPPVWVWYRDEIIHVGWTRWEGCQRYEIARPDSLGQVLSLLELLYLAEFSSQPEQRQRALQLLLHQR